MDRNIWSLEPVFVAVFGDNLIHIKGFFPDLAALARAYGDSRLYLLDAEEERRFLEFSLANSEDEYMAIQSNAPGIAPGWGFPFDLCRQTFLGGGGAEATWQVSAAPGVAAITLVIEKRTLEGNQERLDYHEVARIPMTREGVGKTERWRARHVFDSIGVHGYWFEVKTGGKTFHYQNNREAIYWTREKGSNGVGQIEELSADTRSIRRFRHTVFDPAFKAPTWAKDAIYYYIFPDRFRWRHANDPKPGRDRYQNHAVEFHKSWTDRPYKPGSGDGSDAVYNNDFFGGDLAGIIEKLAPAACRSSPQQTLWANRVSFRRLKTVSTPSQA